MEGPLAFPAIPTGVMTQWSVAIGCGKGQRDSWNTTQSRLSFAKTQVPPRECLATYVLLRNEVANQGVIAINTNCDKQICKFKFIFLNV